MVGTGWGMSKGGGMVKLGVGCEEAGRGRGLARLGK